MAIRGVEFDNQRFTATDHAALFSRMTADGIIDGAAISYSGLKVTIAKGYIVAAGRQVSLDTATAVTVAATNTYARIKLVIDTNNVATKTTFDQANIAVDYANSIGGFAALTQNNINAGSPGVYEIMLAIVRISNGAIAAVEQKIEKTGIKPAGPIWLQYGVHYINANDPFPANPGAGRLIFKKV